MSDEKKVYCGIREPPKKSRRGTMKECAEMGKISYYGIKKIDSKTIKLIEKKKTEGKNLEKMKVKLIGLKSRIKKAKDMVKYEKDAKQKKKLEKQIKEKEKEYNDLLKSYRDKKLKN
jgi:hypothetical protein